MIADDTRDRQRKQRRAKAITESTTAALAELLEPIITRAVVEAGDPDPIIEITREQWPLRRILEAVRAGELGGVSRVGRRYFARRSVVYGFVETHQIRVRRPAAPSSEPPSQSPPPGSHFDRMVAELTTRSRRR
jgi:hypothetical protein